LDFQRAQEIVASPLEFEVSYNGVSIWIDQLHDDEKNSDSSPTPFFRRAI